MTKKIWDLYAPLYEKFMRTDEKVYKLMYKRIPKVVKEKKVLEIATGPGLLAKHIASSAKEVIATDYSEGMIKEARKGVHPDNLKFEVADATNLPYGDNTFDVVIIANALHVMPNPDKALEEIDRVLKKKGILIAPNFIHKGSGLKSKIWSTILKMSGIKFEHQWTKTEYERFLSSHGWRVVNSKEMPSRITMLYTENVRKK
ncbi:MAG: class I SAM-dependent methyltransferase [Lachnospiraceae bacterium]|nr:class I SAM-dependent methyltransferase [Lachnospiraceae bacterium]